VETDHGRSRRHQSAFKLQRMLLRLQKYSFKFVYKPGSKMVIADTLSRAPLLDRTSTEFKGDIAALANAKQQDLLRMVASSVTIELTNELPLWTISISYYDVRSLSGGRSRASRRKGRDSATYSLHSSMDV